jgi:glyoxylase-like metal-dependent hydrolase (beta-lactamase superfamily II)
MATRTRIASISLLALLLSATVAGAAPAAPPPAVEGAIGSLEVHEAARFIAQLYRVQVLVVGGTAEPLHVELGGADSEEALRRLASAAGLALGRKDAIFVLAPVELQGRVEGPRRPLQPGKPINLDLRLAEADDVLRVLAEVLGLQPEGHVGGRLSVFGRGFGSLTLTGLLTRLAGKEASRHDRRLIVGEALPDAPAAPPAFACERADAGEWDSLPCVEAAALEEVAWARRGEQALAALRVRTPTSDRPVVRLIERGRALGKARARVEQIDGGGVLLADGTKIGGAQPAPDFSKVEIKIERLAPNLAILHGKGGNIGVSFGDDGVLLIDDQFAPLNGKLRAAVEMLAKGPARFVFNTHWHGDHTGGNAPLAALGAVIVAHDNVRKRLTSAQFISLFDRHVPPAPPRAWPLITFSAELSFHLNGDEVRVLHVEHAHTDGDSVVWFKKANVVHMGDTFAVGDYPFIDADSGGSIDGFIAAAERVLALCDDHTRIASGHSPLADKQQLAAWRDMLVELRRRVARMKAEHKTAAQVIAAHPTAEFDAAHAQGFIKPDVLVAAIYATMK